MKSIPHLLLPAIAIGVLVTGCKKDEPARVDLGHGYFPTKAGHWIEYQVDSIRVHLEGPSGDTNYYSYALREEITEDFTDAEGRAAQRIIRYTRDTGGVWLPKDVWWQVRDNVRAERSEENVRRIKLVFPPRYSTYWNTNATNVDDEFELTYDEIDVPWSVNGMSFDSTVLVVGTYPSNLIATRIYRERYAKNVGMVFHEVDSIDSQPFPPTTSLNRFYVRYTITGYGN